MFHRPQVQKVTTLKVTDSRCITKVHGSGSNESPAGSASRRIWLRGRMERCASDTCKDPKSYRRRVTGARAYCRPRPAAGLRANGGRHRGVVETVEDQIGGFLR